MAFGAIRRVRFSTMTLIMIYEKAHNFDLYKGGSGDFSVSKWDFAHYSQDFDSLEAFAKKVEITQ
jgi:hypothetical protein